MRNGAAPKAAPLSCVHGLPQISTQHLPGHSFRRTADSVGAMRESLDSPKSLGSLSKRLRKDESVNSPERVIKIVRICFVVYVLLLIYRVLKFPVQPQLSPNSAFEWIVTALALFDVVAGFYAARVLQWMVRRVPQTAPQPTPAKQWMTTSIISLALFISCGLFGLVLHFVGSRDQFAEILLGVSLASLILWRPGTPPKEIEKNLTQI